MRQLVRAPAKRQLGDLTDQHIRVGVALGSAGVESQHGAGVVAADSRQTIRRDVIR